jgi:hypothetical protein
VLKSAPMVLFLRLNKSLTRPSHSVKSTATGFCSGVIRTTEDSTLGGGLKLFLPTFITCSTYAVARENEDEEGTKRAPP